MRACAGNKRLCLADDRCRVPGVIKRHAGRRRQTTDRPSGSHHRHHHHQQSVLLLLLLLLERVELLLLLKLPTNRLNGRVSVGRFVRD